LKDVSGKLIVKDEKLTMDINVCFDGIIGLDGAISTKEKVPTFNMDLSKQVDIAQSFTQLDLLKNSLL
jgi:hypothetical protein